MRLEKLPGVEVWQEAEDGMNVVFPARLFPAVAKIVKPKRKRKVSAGEQKRRVTQGAANLKKHRLAKIKSDFTRAGGTLLGGIESQAV